MNPKYDFNYSTVADDTDQIEEHASVKQLKLTSEQGITVTLEECFKVRTLINSHSQFYQLGLMSRDDLSSDLANNRPILGD